MSLQVGVYSSLHFVSKYSFVSGLDLDLCIEPGSQLVEIILIPVCAKAGSCTHFVYMPDIQYNVIVMI